MVEFSTKRITELLEDTRKSTDTDKPWKAVLFNDEDHSFEEVIIQVMKAIKCDFEKAKSITLQAHYRGRSIVIAADFEECFRVCNVLQEIDLKTNIEG